MGGKIDATAHILVLRCCPQRRYVLGSAAMAADLPKEGTFNFTYAGAGAAKATPVGNERTLFAFDDRGLSVANGLFDHVTFHCWGVGDTARGTTRIQGYCVGTDSDGDHVAIDLSGEWPADAKTLRITNKLTSGTGKYTGISGVGTFVNHGPEFRTAAEGAEGTYVAYGTTQSSYKLP
jgi:hypothetical protein